MQGHCLQAAILGHARQIYADDFGVVPAGAELHGEGNLHCPAYLAEDPFDQRQVAQQSGTAVALYHFLRRAAEVQVHQVEAEVFDQARGIGKHCGIAAEQLRRDGMLVVIEMQVAAAHAAVAEHAVGGSELGHDQPAAAEIADEAAENRVGNAGHGGQNRSRRQRHRANPEGGGDGRLRAGSVGRNRVFPALVHRLLF
jgi:hypothetical protein